MALFQVESLLGKRRAGGYYQYLVKWKDSPLQESTWEAKRNLHSAQSAIKVFDRLNTLSQSGRIQIVYDRLPSYQGGTRHNMMNSGYQLNLRANRMKEQLQKQNSEKTEKAEIPKYDENQNKDPITIIGMNQEKGKFWFYYQKLGIRGWTSRDYLLKNYPNDLLDFYLTHVRVVEELDSEDEISIDSEDMNQE